MTIVTEVNDRSLISEVMILDLSVEAVLQKRLASRDYTLAWNQRPEVRRRESEPGSKGLLKWPPLVCMRSNSSSE